MMKTFEKHIYKKNNFLLIEKKIIFVNYEK